MVSVTSVDAQNRFGELLDRAQREPVAVTRHGRTVAYVVAAVDMNMPGTPPTPPAPPAGLAERRQQAARWYAEYCHASTIHGAPTVQGAVPLTDEDVTRLVHELR